MPGMTSDQERAPSEQELSLQTSLPSPERGTTNTGLTTLCAPSGSIQLRGGRNQALSTLPRKTNTHFLLRLCAHAGLCLKSPFLSSSGEHLTISRSPKLSSSLFNLPSSAFQNSSHPRMRAHITHYFRGSRCLNCGICKNLDGIICYSQCVAPGQAHNKCLTSIGCICEHTNLFNYNFLH